MKPFYRDDLLSRKINPEILRLRYYFTEFISKIANKEGQITKLFNRYVVYIFAGAIPKRSTELSPNGSKRKGSVLFIKNYYNNKCMYIQPQKGKHKNILVIPFHH